MRDVGEAAGVSLKTVSRVVNAEPGVGADTRAKVERAIDALGFQRNDLARSLRDGRTSATVGLVIGDLANPFYAGIARGAEQVAHEHGRLLITASSEEDPGRERQLVASLSARRVDGLLLVPSGADHGFLVDAQRHGLAVVVLDRQPEDAQTDAVLLDNVGGAHQAVRHLLAHGHRRIGVIGDAPSIVTTAERLEGYRRALASAGIAVDDNLLRLGPHDVVEAERAAHDLLACADPPTAVFTANNRMTVGALRALRTLGWTHVGLVGFDDLELADLLPTPVTVVSHDPSEMGRRAAELLFARIEGRGGPVRRIVLATRLVLRGSGEVAAR